MKPQPLAQNSSCSELLLNLLKLYDISPARWEFQLMNYAACFVTTSLLLKIPPSMKQPLKRNIMPLSTIIKLLRQLHLAQSVICLAPTTLQIVLLTHYLIIKASFVKRYFINSVNWSHSMRSVQRKCFVRCICGTYMFTPCISGACVVL